MRGLVIEAEVVDTGVLFFHLIDRENKLLDSVPASQLQLALRLKVGEAVSKMRARVPKLLFADLVVKRTPFYVLT